MVSRGGASVKTSLWTKIRAAIGYWCLKDFKIYSPDGRHCVFPVYRSKIEMPKEVAVYFIKDNYFVGFVSERQMA